MSGRRVVGWAWIEHRLLARLARQEAAWNVNDHCAGLRHNFVVWLAKLALIFILRSPSPISDAGEAAEGF